MRIQHNISALNSHRNLMNNNTAVGKNLEKLSSGYRINRAGDDAAGLAISEKMRAQITGLTTATKNAEDGVSLVQTAEGALTEVHSMLNRMVELATQSANGTYSESNRKEMQKEISNLQDEIDRISNTANFNGTKLFKKEEVAADAPAVNPPAGGAGANGIALAAMVDAEVEFGADNQGGVITPATKGSIEVSITDAAEQFKITPTGGEEIVIEAEVGRSMESLKTALNEAFGGSFNVTVNESEDGLIIEAAVEGASGASISKIGTADATDWTAGTDATGTAFVANDTVTIDGTTYTCIASDATEVGENEFKTDADLVALLEEKGYTAEIDMAHGVFSVQKDDGVTEGGTEETAATYKKGDAFVYDFSKIKTQPNDGDTIEILGKIFTFKDAEVTAPEGDGGNTPALAAATPTDAGDVTIGETLDETMANLAKAVAADSTIAAKFDVSYSDGKMTMKAKADAAAGDVQPGEIAGTWAAADEVGFKEGPKGSSVVVDLHVGESSSENNTIQVEIKEMNTSSIGVTNDAGEIEAGKSIADVDISTQKGAKEAIDVVNAAIDQISSIRSDLGAMQNRLEHTINNLGVQTENITAAESRVRDVDMAKEMMTYTKNNILVQASQAMLAQANQVPQGVLQLLQ